MSGYVDVAVVGRARHSEALAASAASVLAPAAGSRSAVVVRTGAGGARRLAPPTRHASRLRERLLARGLEPVASGRVVWCAASSARDVSLAAVGSPVVLAVCGPREPWIEPLLDEAGLVLVAGEEHDTVVQLALEELRERAIPAAASSPPAGATALLGRSGVWPDPALRALIEREALPA